MSSAEAGVKNQSIDSFKSLSICLKTYRGNPTCGGQGVYIKNLSLALAKLGHKVTVVSGQPYPNLDPHKNIELVKLPTLNMTDAKNKITGFKLAWLSSKLDLWEYFSSLSGKFPDPQSFGVRFVRWLHATERSFDIIHDNQTLSYTSLQLQDMLPLTTTIHHPITRDLTFAVAQTDSYWMKIFVRRWYSFLKMQMFVAPKLQSVVSPSVTSKTDMSDDLAVPESVITPLPLGVDQTVFKPMPAIKKEGLRIMSTVSADAPLKGMIYLLKSFKRLVEKNIDIRLTLIGTPKEGGESAKYIKAHNLAQYITFTGFITEQEMVEHYARATVAVVPSLYEGFCIPAIEAMSCGVPLVVTDAGSIPEIVANAGIICEAGNADALAMKIFELLHNPEQRNTLIQAGKKLVNEKYDWEIIAEKMTKLYLNQIADFHSVKSQSDELSYANN